MPPLQPSYILDFFWTHVTFAYYGKLFDEEYVQLCTTKLEASVDFDFMENPHVMLKGSTGRSLLVLCLCAL